MTSIQISGGGLNHINWDNLTDRLAGEAVLVLGPDAIPMYRIGEGGVVEQTTFGKLSRGRIRENLNIAPLNYYERDNLFLFKDQKEKNDARRIVREAARDSGWLQDEELLQKIVAIPFSVVLNMSPEQMVFEAFARHFRTPQFDFCTPYDKDSAKPIEMPTHANPMVYNLCGNVVEKLDSPILDYFDMFQLFTKLLGNDDEVPQELKHKLRDADTYILLGFDLDRWYFQLFLHYLNWLDRKAYKNENQNYPLMSELSGDCHEFILRQFNITHIAPSRTDFDELYAACSRKGILRRLHDPRTPVENQVRVLIGQDKIDEAIELFEYHKDKLEQGDILLPHLRGRLEAWRQSKQAGIADSRDLETEINKIRHTLLAYTAQLGTNP